ncbi:hypothetical protein ALT785_660018 [Alteromonas infernus]
MYKRIARKSALINAWVLGKNQRSLKLVQGVRHELIKVDIFRYCSFCTYCCSWCVRAGETVCKPSNGR